MVNVSERLDYEFEMREVECMQGVWVWEVQLGMIKRQPQMWCSGQMKMEL